MYTSGQWSQSTKPNPVYSHAPVIRENNMRLLSDIPPHTVFRDEFDISSFLEKQPQLS
jgi:hypothetical protein